MIGGECLDDDASANFSSHISLMRIQNVAPLRLATATVNAYKAAAGSSVAVVTFLSRRSYTQTVRPFFVVFFQQIWTFSIVGFLFKRLTFLPYS